MQGDGWRISALRQQRKTWARGWAVTVVLALGLVACGGDSAATTTEPTTGSATVSINAFAFTPATITVAAGTTVTWRNDQAVNHTVTGDSTEFDSAELAQDAEFSQTFDTPGEFAYHCEIHASMTGKVIVEG